MRSRWLGIPLLVAVVVGVGLLDAHLRGELISPEPEPEPVAVAPSEPPVPVASRGTETDETSKPTRKRTREQLRAELDAELAAQNPPEPAPAPAPPQPMLWVTVVDADGQPVPGALVRSTDATGKRVETRTDQLGKSVFRVPNGKSRFRLAALAGTNTALYLGDDPHTDVTTSVASTQVTLTVTEPLAFVEATVRDAHSGDVVANSPVEIRASGSPKLIQQVRTDANGVARALVTPLLRYELKAASRFAKGTQRIVGPVLIGTTERTNLELSPPGYITGSVTDSNGATMRWAWVWAIPTTPPGLTDLPWSELKRKLGTTWRVRRAATDLEGRYRVSDLDVNGVYHVVAQVPHGLDSLIWLDVAVPPEGATVNLTVPATRPLTVVVFGKQGATVKGTTVRVKTPSRGWLDAEHLGAGSYRFLGLEDGGHTLTVDAPGHQLVRKYLDYPKDAVESMRIDLR